LAAVNKYRYAVSPDNFVRNIQGDSFEKCSALFALAYRAKDGKKNGVFVRG
jgi:hypothetical protein